MDGWLLAFDLSTPRGVLVLEGPGGTFWREIAGHERTAGLFVEASALLREAGVDREEIALLGVGRGPGSFTGVRVAVAAAKTLAFSLQRPLVAPESLAVRAAGTGLSAGLVFVVLDARRNEVYYGAYRMAGGCPQAILGPGADVPERAADRFASCREKANGEAMITGTGVDAFPHAWPPDLAVVVSEPPGAEGLSRLCRLKAERGELADPFKLKPLYVRRPELGRTREQERCAW